MQMMQISAYDSNARANFHGESSMELLSDEALLSVLLGGGASAQDLARRVLAVIDAQQGRVTIRQLSEVRGLSDSNALRVCAALEIVQRMGVPAHWKITSPEDALPLLAHYADRAQEHFIVLCLNGAHCVTQKRVVSVGIVNQTLVHPREVFSPALEQRSAAVIVAHNHPSGDVTPSAEDHAVTELLRGAGKILEIPLLDHIIFSMNNYYSFAVALRRKKRGAEEKSTRRAYPQAQIKKTGNKKLV